MGKIRDIFGYVDRESYPGKDHSKRIDNLIQKYEDKEKEFVNSLALDLKNELKKRGWINSMGVTFKEKLNI